MSITTLPQCFLIILFSNELTYSKKMSLPDVGSSNLDIGECQQCKLLSDSVNYWLEKTSRGKFEGGDAIWEETKLKSYSRSEIRLVEIQEGLCSELKRHKDQCYALAEETEQVLEKWWFNEDLTTVDLYSWLCIDTLQYCCPKKHFGDLCTPCPLDKNNEVCGGKGSCNGDGTRKGDGTCICKRGYSGEFCGECAKNFYSENTECKPCHKACSQCAGDGPSACKECKSGWQNESGVCVDINECSKPSTCKHNEYCINREGSYTCKGCDKLCKSCVGAGSSNCTSCDIDKLLWSGMCIDDKLRSDILKDTLQRSSLYLGLLIITIFIFRTSRSLASFIVILITMYIYYSEKSSRMSVLDVIFNIYFK